MTAPLYMCLASTHDRRLNLQTAGGAIEASETPLDGAVKESHEEAGLTEEAVRKFAK